MSADLTPEQAFAAALAAFQKDMPEVTKEATGQVGNAKTKYADLAHIAAQAYPKLAEHGLAFTASPTLNEDGAFVLRYALLHKSGHREGGAYPLPASATSQQIGSALTYARRYCLLAVTGIAPKDDDDDGQQGSEVKTTAHPRTRQIAPEPVTDTAWAEDFRRRIDVCTTTDEVRTLWQEAARTFREGRLTGDDRIDLESLMTARTAELTGSSQEALV